MEVRFSVISDSVGFALMKMPAALNASYERQHASQKSALEQFRAVLKTVNPAAYRGIERCPLAEDPVVEPWIRDADRYTALDQRDIAARVRFLEIVGPYDYTGMESCVVPTLEYAQELIRLVDSPDEHEIVRLSKSLPDTQSSKNDLGFDIGYWGGESYSILCDSAIWPVWHGPDDDVLPELARRLADLNQHSLFPSYEAAARFRAYYWTQDWAETEGQPGEFCIIKIEATDEATSSV